MRPSLDSQRIFARKVEPFGAVYQLVRTMPDSLHPSAGTRMQGERGIALIMALFVMAILSLVGITYMTTSTLETKINSNSRSSYPVFYAAEAGLEEGTYRLQSNADQSNRPDLGRCPN